METLLQARRGLRIHELQLSTWRVVIPQTDRSLCLGFSASPRFAECPDVESSTANDVAEFASEKAAVAVLMSLLDAGWTTKLSAFQVVWATDDSVLLSRVLDRVRRTAVETALCQLREGGLGDRARALAGFGRNGR